MSSARSLLSACALTLIVACDSSTSDPPKSQGEPSAAKSAARGPASASARPAGSAATVASSAAPSASASPDTAPGASASAATSAEPAAGECGSPKEIPAIPDAKSNPPSVEEWSKGCAVNTQGAGTEAKDCTMEVLREWLKVTCNGDVIRVEDMDGFGNEGDDHYKTVTPGKVASFVVRLKKGRNPKVRICRAKDRASLFVSWPPSVDKPKIIALAAGAPCEG